MCVFDWWCFRIIVFCNSTKLLFFSDIRFIRIFVYRASHLNKVRSLLAIQTQYHICQYDNCFPENKFACKK